MKPAIWKVRINSLLLSAVFLCSLSAACATPASAPATSEKAAPAQENLISLSREVLIVSLGKITVDDDLRNDTSSDIALDVNLPDQQYSYGPSAPNWLKPDDFALFVNGKSTTYDISYNALLEGADISEKLRALHIDIPTLGHSTEIRIPEPSRHSTTYLIPVSLDYNNLTPRLRNKAADLNYFDVFDQQSIALWTVEKKRHWRQVFPAHTVTHIRYQYSPSVGMSFVDPMLLTKPGQKAALADFSKLHPAGTDNATNHVEVDIANLDHACLDHSMQKNLVSKLTQYSTIPLKRAASDAFPVEWVDLDLSTANPWKMPINQMDIIVDKTDVPKELIKPHDISLCWSGKIKRSWRSLQASATNFQPPAKLHILFLP